MSENVELKVVWPFPRWGFLDTFVFKMPLGFLESKHLELDFHILSNKIS